MLVDQVLQNEGIHNATPNVQAISVRMKTRSTWVALVCIYRDSSFNAEDEEPLEYLGTKTWNMEDGRITGNINVHKLD